MTKKLIIGLVIGIILSIVIVGCSASAPAPATSTKSSPAASQPAASQAPAAHELVTLNFLTGKFGGPSYIVLNAFKEYFAANHPWLRFQNIETNSGEDAMLICEEDPKAKKISIMSTGPAQFWLARNQQAPFEKNKITDLRNVGHLGIAGVVVYTLDPNIKTMNDLAGKRLGTLNRGHSIEITLGYQFKASNIYDKINFSYLGFAAAKDALLNGTVDAAVSSMTYVGINDWQPRPEIQEAMGARKVYLVDWPNAAVDQKKMEEIAGLKFPVTEIPANALPTQQKPIKANQTFAGCPMMYDSMPVEYVYEFVKTAIEACEKGALTKYDVKTVTYTAQSWADACEQSVGKEFTHPGAIKYFKERGIAGW